MLPVALRLSLAVSLVLLLSVVVTAALNFLKFNQVTETLEASRYDFLTRDIKHAFEQNLTLGLPLEQIANARAILERQAALDPSITRIEVFAADGRVLHGTGRLDAAWTAALLKGDAGDGSVGGRAPTETFNSRALVNDFGQTVGGVVVYRSTAPALARKRAILQTLMVAVIGATIAGVCITVLGATRLSRDVRERLRATATALRATLQTSRPESGQSSRPASGQSSRPARGQGSRPAAEQGAGLAAAAALAMAEIDALEAEIDQKLAHGPDR